MLVLGSGTCALVYQTAWLRLFRLFFGSSTAASAAVLAVFMGGLGVGGLILGRRADSARNPIRLYGLLELGIAIAAAVSPALIGVARGMYIAVGGSQSLGLVGGTAARLVLAAIVLAVPTLLMGGTLPAVARAVESQADVRRRQLALVYGMNTLGAVAGTLWTTFVALEYLGTRGAIWSASALNIAVALAALALARRWETPAAKTQPVKKPRKRTPSLPSTVIPVTSAPLIFVAAGIVGFAFFVMELVWYRMLTPLLGGTSYTFGLILAVALLGIGIGGLLYAAFGQERGASAAAFAFTCALEAALIALPYGLGDRIALFALAQREGAVAFQQLVWGWFLVTSVVLLPPAIIAGYQFPLLLGLIGQGRERVGEETGRVYASNTAGAIIGSLAGGFGLLPLLTAPGLWRAVVYLLGALSVAVVVFTGRRGDRSRKLGLATVAVAALAVAFCFAKGPTQFWRHSAIGAGRVQVALSDPNAVRAAINKWRLEVFWAVDGVESSIAMDRENGLAFYVNGKSDGNAIFDAPTQVMLGLVGSIIHPNPRRALVIGLGTGETAGWLAQVPSIEAVDVFELEPSVVQVAEACALANQDALSNPKVHITFGDARELLLTTKQTYDLIASEPSNPYRAGTASLFTKEFYQAVAGRLGPAGIFMQWVQGYEVRDEALRSVYATLDSVFPSVETWELMLAKDFGFLASKGDLVHDLDRVRARAGSEPYRTALPLVWGVDGAEGLYTGYIGNAGFARAFHSSGTTAVNTDDRTVLEFEFARTVGLSTIPDLSAGMRKRAFEGSHGRPRFSSGTLEWTVVEDRLGARATAQNRAVGEAAGIKSALNTRQLARRAYVAEKFEEARRQWFSQADEPTTLADLRLVSEVLAVDMDSRALHYIEALRPWQPVEAEALLAVWSMKAGQSENAINHLHDAIRSYRRHPWTNVRLFLRAFNQMGAIFQRDPAAAAATFAQLGEPFAVRALDMARLGARANIGLDPPLRRLCVEALEPLEPEVPWSEALLRRRAACYEDVRSPLVRSAQGDLRDFLAGAGSQR